MRAKFPFLHNILDTLINLVQSIAKSHKKYYLLNSNRFYSNGRIYNWNATQSEKINPYRVEYV